MGLKWKDDVAQLDVHTLGHVELKSGKTLDTEIEQVKYSYTSVLLQNKQAKVILSSLLHTLLISRHIFSMCIDIVLVRWLLCSLWVFYIEFIFSTL